jgi:RNA polymerase sigma-70 factor, ECF subfamily
VKEADGRAERSSKNEVPDMLLTLAEGAPTQVNTVSDEALLHMIVQRDEQALGILYDRYIGLVYALALRVTNSREMAEDVVQTVFQTIWEDAHTCYPSAMPVAAWVVEITRHLARGAVNSQYRLIQSDKILLDPAHTLNGEKYVESAGSKTALYDAAYEALRTLPIPQRQTLQLAYYGKLTCNEIAQLTGQSLGVVKANLRLAVLTFHNLLRQHNAS